MPTISLDRVVLPNLKVYFFGSLLALLACVYYTLGKDTFWSLIEEEQAIKLKEYGFRGKKHLIQLAVDLISIMIRDPVCVWTIINMVFCIIILLGHAVQKCVFGELRVSEQQHLRDKFWNFLFYKFIFVFGVINVQYLNEVLLWCSWFVILGFLQLLSNLSKERFEYLLFSPKTPTWNHIKLMVFLLTVLALSNVMLVSSVFIGFYIGLNIFIFMSTEVILLLVRTLHVIVKYSIYLYDIKHEGDSTNSIEAEKQAWEKRGLVSYYIDYIFEMLALIIELFNHAHMLLGGNIFLSMASLVICMQLRYLLQEIQKKFNRHKNYLWIRSHLEENYPMAKQKELDDNSDNCAICWEKMKSARKLPCMHMFHNTCLVSWLEQDGSCPTCRLSLNIQSLSLVNPRPVTPNNLQENIRRPLNHFFHFDGSRYVSWLPSFSVEVSPAGTRHNFEATNSQLDAMARRVQQLFPNLPLSQIIEDLRVTRSVELTVENILDGRISSTSIPFRDLGTNSQSAASVSLLPSDYESNATSGWDEFSSDFIEGEDMQVPGTRFSKSSSEREKILQCRKDNMIKMARKRYIEKQRSAKTAV